MQRRGIRWYGCRNPITSSGSARFSNHCLVRGGAWLLLLLLLLRGVVWCVVACAHVCLATKCGVTVPSCAGERYSTHYPPTTPSALSLIPASIVGFVAMAHTIEWMQRHPDYVYPTQRYNEVRAYIERGLQDVSVSRLAAKLRWGTPPLQSIVCGGVRSDRGGRGSVHVLCVCCLLPPVVLLM